MKCVITASGYSGP
uniref:Uncharacterized protein n=1 Tax=Anguilla anguilla TaxID=7936 RepID=A0A0E9TD40_ANGAN